MLVQEPGFFAAAALNDTKKSHDESTYTSKHFLAAATLNGTKKGHLESTYTSEHFLVSFRAESAERRIPVLRRCSEQGMDQLTMSACHHRTTAD